jgi:hypothetical protein
VKNIFGRGRDLTPEDLQKQLRHKLGVHLTDPQTRALFTNIDVDMSGTIDLYEFYIGLMPSYNPELNFETRDPYIPLAPTASHNRRAKRALYVHAVPKQPQKTVEQIEAELHQKLDSRTSKRSDYFSRAFQVKSNLRHGLWKRFKIVDVVQRGEVRVR